MKETTKRILSLVLAFVMVLGLLPGLSVNVSAAEDAHYLMFATDRHANTSVIGEIINNMESAIGENKLEYLALGGDMVGSGNTHPAYNSSTVLSEVTGATSSLNAANVDIVAGIHDMNVTDDAGIVLPYQGGGAQIYEGDDYYIYGVEEYCISEDSNEENWSKQAQAFVTWANGETIDKSKVIFISSHYPLHAKRDDNDGAYYWHKALNTVATGGDSTVERDIVFFHGHNHTEDSNEYVYNVGEIMSIQNGSSTESDTIYYTYATAGYLNQNKKATLVTITDDKIVLTKYSTSDSGSTMATVERVEQPATVNTVTGTEESTQDTVTAVGLGLTGVTLTQSENADTSAFQSGCVAYDVVLEGYVEGETVTLTFDIGYMDSTDLVVYADGEQISPVSVENVIAEDGFASVLVTVETTSAAGTYIIGKLAAAEDAVLTGIEVTAMPTTTNYTLVMDEADDGNIYLDITGLVITATYDNGQTIPVEWDQFEESNDGYALEFDISVAGTRTVKVTYGSFETSFDVTVYEPNAVDADVAEAVADVLKEGYIAKEFAPTDYTEGTEIRVIMPAPENANVVYHVADDGTLTKIEGVTFHGSYVIFDTDHFSSYVVGQSTEIEVPDPETVTGSGSTTTTEEKTVYVLVDTPTADNQYIIVNRNTAGSGYALKENTTTGSSITVNAAGSGISAPWIETTDETIMWNAASGMTYQSENGGYYLRYNSGLAFSTRYSTDWTYTSGKKLYYDANTDRYLRYNNGWTTTNYSSYATSVYFYEKQIVEVETTTNVSGTYSIAGNPAEVTKVVTNGSTVELGSTLTFTPDSGSATTTENPTGVTYTVVENGDPNGVISGISGNTVTFSGAYGKALVKISYTTALGEVTNYIVVNASEPTYVLDITSGDDVVTGTTIPVKGVTASTTLQLGTRIQFVDEEGQESVELPEGATIEWHIPEEYHNIATVGHESGLVTFKGVDGAFYVTATLTVGDKDYTKGVNISATTTSYSTPNDGPADFPEYPNEGAIRFDKTATAVGNFSETGIAQVELSMTGVPYTTGSEIDVVIMLDMTGSMSDTAMTAAEESAIAFAEQIVKNTDGTYNQNRIAVLAFNSGNSSPYTLWAMGVVEEDNWSSFCTNVRTASDKQASGGTPYDEALAKCRSVLQAAKTDGIGNDRQQFCVFVSDGGPTSYQYITNYDAVKAGTASAYTTKTASASGGSNQSDSNFATIATYTHEYYSTLMKDDGVTMYSVLTGLVAANYPNCTTIMQNIASDSTKAFVVENGNDTSSLTNAFTNIAAQIMQAATDVTVEDKITDEYTMIFDIPEGTKDITGVTNDFYIEFGKYALDEDHERDTYTSVTKLYLKNTNGTLSAAKDSTGTAYDAPTFEQKPIGDKGTVYYWTTDLGKCDTGVSVTVGDTSYYFVSYGMKSTDEGFDSTKWFNMTSGGYAYGTIEDTNMSEDLVIATPYFVYNANTRMIYWTVDKLDTYEYTLRYFLYLNNSATEVATSKETDPGPYPTNDHAYITYTNFNGNDCRQVFPIPQLTWNGAQVSYVFYLVNAAGQPINKSGQVVDFANATFITDVYTEAVVWNKAGETSTGTGELSANWLADDLLPDEYEIYDKEAHYALNVYEKADGSTIKNQFTISGGTKAAISESLNTRLKLDTTANTVSISTTKVYNTKAGEKISAYGTYTSADNNMKGFDFANTTVAFAVVWQPRLVEDVVVVDYGLDVIINVVQNDILQNKVTGIGISDEAYRNAEVEINTGVSTTSKLGTAKLTTEGNNTISIENDTSVRFRQGDMEFEDAVTFYYETPVEFWEGSNPKEGYMYSSVTVIPATTIYYEDGFVTYDSFTWDYQTNKWGSFVKKDVDGDGDLDDSLWHLTDPELSNTQAQDRPGDSQISGSIDADNIYGYDGAYTTMNGFSNGSAMIATVDYDNYAQAQFEFYGTGFDVISLTSNTTGTILVDVKNLDTNQMAGNFVVDTYYGYDLVEYGCYTYTLMGYRTCQYTYSNGAWTAKFVGGVLSEPFTSQTQPVNPVEGDTYEICEEFWQISADYEKVDALKEDESRPVGAEPGTAYKVYRGIFQIAPNNPNALYQIPVMKIEDLPYGRYQVTIKATYDRSFDHEQYGDQGKYDFYLDAIRIYDPANNGEGNTVISDAYEKDHEAYPHYFELRNAIITANDFENLDSDPVSGIVYIDGYDVKTPTIRDYLKYGPNNELYLSNDQAVAFAFNTNAILKAIADEDTNAVPDGFVIDRVHIGLKLVTGTTATAQMYDAGAANGNTFSQKLTTATDMYYDITDLVSSSALVIKNTSADGILSITDIKVTYKAADSAAQTASAEPALMTMSVGEVAEESIFLVSRDIGQMALASMMAAEEPEEPTEPEVPTEPEEPTEPESFTPGLLTMKVNKTSAKVGQKVQVTITTSADVCYLTINGQKLTAYKNIRGGYTRSWTVTLTAQEAGEMEIAVVAYDSNDVASEAVTTTVKVTAKNWLNGKF